MLGVRRRCNAVLPWRFLPKCDIHATIWAALKVALRALFSARFCLAHFLRISVFHRYEKFCLCVALLFWSPIISRSR